MLDQLKTNASQGLTLIQNQETSVQARISAYGQLTSAMQALSTAANALSATAALGQLSASVSGSDVTASVVNNSGNPGSTPAVAGTYSLQVNQLATTQTLVAAGQADQTAAIGADGQITFTMGDGTQQTLDMTGKDTSVKGIMEAINSDASLGLQATILNDGSGTPYRLMISPTQSGTDAAITDISVTGNAALSSYLSMGSMTQQSATNAELTVNGVSITSSSNVVADAIPGVTLDLNNASGTTQTMTIAQDTSAASKAISAYVTAYNNVQTTLASLTAFDTSTETGSVLTGDSVARRIQTSLASIMNQTSTSETAFPNLGSIGIISNADGTLSVDQDKLNAALSSNLGAVSSLFDSAGGISDFTNNVVDSFTDTNGGLTAATAGANAQLTDLQNKYTQQSALIDAQMSSLQTQFAALDASVATMNNTSTYLTQQFAAMSKSSS